MLGVGCHKRSAAFEDYPNHLVQPMSGRKRRRSDMDRSGPRLTQRDDADDQPTMTLARLEHVPDVALEAIVDSLDDADFAACMTASRLFWVCSKTRTRARILSKTLTPDEVVLMDDPTPVLDYMRRRRGVRFRPCHLYAAAKRNRIDAVRWLVANADWHVDDATSMDMWLAAKGRAHVALVAESDADACYETCKYDQAKQSGGVCQSCAPSSMCDLRRLDATCIRVPLCLCNVGDAAAKRGHRAVIDTLLATPGYGHTDYGALLAAVNGHMDMAEYLMDRGRAGILLGSHWPDDDIVSEALRCDRLDVAARFFEAAGRPCSSEVLVHYVPETAARWTERKAWTDTTNEPNYYPEVDDDSDDDSDDDGKGHDDDEEKRRDDGDVAGPLRDDRRTKALAQQRRQYRCDESDRRAYAKMERVLGSGLIVPGEVQHAVDRALVFAVHRGRMTLVRLLHEKRNARLTDDGVPPGQRHRGHNHNEPIASAAVKNDVRMLTYMIGERGTAVVGPDAMDDAAREGALAALAYLADHSDARPSPRALKRAASAGHANTVAFLCERMFQHCRIGPALCRALAAGHSLTTSVLLEHALVADVRYALETALGDDRVRLCRALTLRGAPRGDGDGDGDDDGNGDGDVGHGDAGLAERPEDAARISPARIAMARRQLAKAEARGTDALVACVDEWGHETAVAAYANQPVQDYAACNGSIELLSTFLRLGLGTATPSAMSNAMFNGRVSAMRLLHQHYNVQGPWVGLVLDDAVANGHMNALVFAQTHFDWPWWSARAVDKAAAEGRLRVVRFLHARRSPDRPWCTTDALDGAIRGTHWRTAAFLHAAGASCTLPAIDEACREAAKPSCCCLWLGPLMEAIHQRSLGAS
ncbi:Ankyrin repeat protein [Pandoravirus kuranda]|uniref:Ankyrin repeat protein n=1 Tax=Pandoravirus kuranda TaxID=3019033 RepID=A0AA95EID8_9VIRU|nr:Ankyrin repeat protein [Pandoravirus kuranda]